MRSCPLTMSIPTAARMKPNRIDVTVLIGDLPVSPTKALKVSIMTANTSAGPNFNANSARMGEKKVRTMQPKRAPTPWERKESTSALPGLPFLAMG